MNSKKLDPLILYSKRWFKPEKNYRERGSLYKRERKRGKKKELQWHGYSHEI